MLAFSRPDRSDIVLHPNRCSGIVPTRLRTYDYNMSRAVSDAT